MYIQEGIWLCLLETYQLGYKASDKIRGEFNSNCVYVPFKMSQAFAHMVICYRAKAYGAY